MFRMKFTPGKRCWDKKSSCNVETLTMERLNYVFFQTMLNLSKKRSFLQRINLLLSLSFIFIWFLVLHFHLLLGLLLSSIGSGITFLSFAMFSHHLFQILIFWTLIISHIFTILFIILVLVLLFLAFFFFSFFIIFSFLSVQNLDKRIKLWNKKKRNQKLHRKTVVGSKKDENESETK